MPSTRATTTRPTDRELDPDAIQWVEATLAGMDDTRRLRALFALAAFSDSPAELDELARHQPGAVMLAGAADATATRRAVERLQAGQSLPLLIAGDIEGGLWNPAGLSATPSPLALAAADDPALTAALAAAAARQARAAGYNWTFAPVLDLNVAWRSAIVGTRSYGADAGRVLAHARAYVQGMQSEGVACTAKHWPGEGQDERDQHLLTTWNPQSMGEWDSSHGNLYRGLIEAGVMGVMAGHIAFPAGCDDHPALAAHPASVNPALNQGLLRKRMGFTGLLVSDATLMAGLAGQMPRDELVTAVIAGGCDMLLFSLDPAADLRALQQALAEGRLTTRRVEEAVRRQLEMKARLGLHRTTPAPATLQDINHLDELVDRACAQAVTLVRDAGVLPLSPARHRRIAVYEQAGKPMLPGMVAPTITALMAALRDRGFEPFHAAPNQPLDLTRCDLVLYVVTQESAPTLGRTGLDWTALQGDFPWSMQRHWHVVPAVLVSFGHPYLLIDAPQVPVYVNAYSALAPMQRAVVAALTGAAPFTGRNPVDPFCGLPQAAFTAISPLPKQARTAARSPA